MTVWKTSLMATLVIVAGCVVASAAAPMTGVDLVRGGFSLALKINEGQNYIIALASWQQPPLVSLLSQLPTVTSMSPWIPMPVQIRMPGGVVDTWGCGVGMGYPISTRKDEEQPQTPVRLLSGRFFIPADLTDQAKVAVISKRLMLRAGFTNPEKVLNNTLLISFERGANLLSIKVVGVYEYESGPLVQSGAIAVGVFPKNVELFMRVKEEDILIPYVLLPLDQQQRQGQSLVIVTKPGEAGRTAQVLREAFNRGLITPSEQ